MIGKGGSAVQSGELAFQEFGLVQVLALFGLLVHPQIGVRAGNVKRHHAGKERVARILRGRGQDGEINLLLRVEIGREFRREHAPLVVAKIVEHEQHHAPTGRQAREHRAAQHIGREGGARRRIGIGHPIGVVCLHKLGEGRVGLFLLVAQQVGHRPVGAGGQLQFPVHQALVEFHPSRGIVGRVHVERELGELAAISRFGLLLHNLVAVDVPFQRHENLHRVDGFEQIVGNLCADGLVHEVLGLVFGDHHHGHVGLHLFDGGEGFESRESRHVFVEEHEVEPLCATKLHRVVAVGGGGDVVTSFFEKKAVGAEQIDFVVHPKQACTHGQFVLVGGGGVPRPIQS